MNTNDSNDVNEDEKSDLKEEKEIKSSYGAKCKNTFCSISDILNFPTKKLA